MRKNQNSATGNTQPGAPRRAVVFVVAGVLIAVVGVAVGVRLASEVRLTCADSDIDRLVNLVCKNVRRTHPHLLLGVLLLVGTLAVGAAMVAAGITEQRRRAPR